MLITTIYMAIVHVKIELKYTTGKRKPGMEMNGDRLYLWEALRACKISNIIALFLK